jgi:predicted rRNA methylase YqxC with S4 and FtsJ domains
VLEKAADYARHNDFRVLGITRSPIQGPAGNVEFLMHLAAVAGEQPELSEMIEEAMTS